jgi:hypothetical protein
MTIKAQVYVVPHCTVSTNTHIDMNLDYKCCSIETVSNTAGATAREQCIQTTILAIWSTALLWRLLHVSAT